MVMVWLEGGQGEVSPPPPPNTTNRPTRTPSTTTTFLSVYFFPVPILDVSTAGVR